MPITKCTITATIKDLLEAVPASLDAYILIKSGTSFFHGTTLIPAFEIRANFSSITGIATPQVIETATPGKKLECSIVYTDGVRKKVIRMNPFIVPNSSTANLAELTAVDQYSTF